MLFNTSRNYLIFKITATCCYMRVSLILLTTNLLINGSITMMCECIPHVILPWSHHVTHHWVAHLYISNSNPLKVVVQLLQNKWIDYWIKESSATLSSMLSRRSSSKILGQNLEDGYSLYRTITCIMFLSFMLLQNKWVMSLSTNHTTIYKKKMGDQIMVSHLPVFCPVVLKDWAFSYSYLAERFLRSIAYVI